MLQNFVVDNRLILGTNLKKTFIQRSWILNLKLLLQIGSLSFIGKFETDTGWVKNLATINRINDVSVTRPDPMKTTFRVTLRIKDLQVIIMGDRGSWKELYDLINGSVGLVVLTPEPDIVRSTPNQNKQLYNEDVNF